MAQWRSLLQTLFYLRLRTVHMDSLKLKFLGPNQNPNVAQLNDNDSFENCPALNA